MTDVQEREERSLSDERNIARAVAVGLPVVTGAAAAIVAALLGPATSILVVAAGVLLGVIALLWGSLRVLTGDAPISPEMEALAQGKHGVDALSIRKKMLLRALKDIENEHGLGKLDAEDYEQISTRYRDELKAVLKSIDEALSPHRAKAEQMALEQLRKAGIVAGRSLGEQPSRSEADAGAGGLPGSSTERVTCPECGASNEPDSKFCKECARSLLGRESLSAKKDSVIHGDESDGG